MGLTFVLWLTALELTRSAARLAHLVYLAPFLALLFLHLIIGKPIAASTPVGLVMIVGAVLWHRITAMRRASLNQTRRGI